MIVKFSELQKLRKALKDKKIVLGGGVFDLLHQGHLKFLANLRKFGDVTVVAISTDRRARERKGFGRPVLPQKERLTLIDSIKHVDYVLIAPELIEDKESPTMRVIENLMPDVFLTVDRKWFKSAGKIKNMGVKLKIITSSKSNSTTKIIGKIINNHRKQKRLTKTIK